MFSRNKTSSLPYLTLSSIKTAKNKFFPDKLGKAAGCSCAAAVKLLLLCVASILTPLETEKQLKITKNK